MMMCCACCGVAEIDEIKLTKCDDCDLVRYCSNECTVYAEGLIGKEDYLAALLGYQAAIEATRSQQREAAERALHNRV